MRAQKDLLRFSIASRGGFVLDAGMKSLFITGTDTEIGKTVLTALLARRARARGFSVAALKPVCSGGRDDALALHAALDSALALDEINPWHFGRPIAPVLAARKERRKLTLAAVAKHIRGVQRKFPLLIVEGAGGLLSPLGEDFDSRDLIQAIDAMPIIVCPNRLGAINQTLLVLEALPPKKSRAARVVLMTPRAGGSRGVAGGNAQFLARKLGSGRVVVFPWLANPRSFGNALRNQRVRSALDSLLRGIRIR